ncbi:MAG: ferredoxin [Armatimonadetes bacterium]|nr:ferredoxin [Armatimonadota bacterium]
MPDKSDLPIGPSRPIRPSPSRRDVIVGAARFGGAIAAGGALLTLARGARSEPTVPQIDPSRCIQCGKCATECVMTPSAVKCVHAYALCGYCKLCFGLFRDKRTGNTLTAENNRCPVDAIKRRPVEDPFFEMYIDEPACIGCGICVKGCNRFGNGSLYLQIRHDRCVNCNQCAIAKACPSDAFVRVPASRPYLIRTVRKT